MSMYVDEYYHSVHTIMYADDIAVFNDTVGRMKKPLDSLSQFCTNYGLVVNMAKTKIIVFRNGGTLRRNERFYYDENQLEIITYYKYLGIVFSSSLQWSMAMRTIAQQANRAMCVLRDVKYKCGQIPLSVSFELLDKMILPGFSVTVPWAFNWFLDGNENKVDISIVGTNGKCFLINAHGVLRWMGAVTESTDSIVWF